MNRGRRWGSAVCVTAALALPTGCVSLPNSGPVMSGDPTTEQSFRPANYIDPPPPRPLASQAEIVNGFLGAMRAFPRSTRVAEQYLSSGFRASWDPSRETITYAGKGTPKGQGWLSVDLDSANLVNGDGRWLGPIGAGSSTLGFRLVLEDGEWRISRARDALVVPQTWFEPRYVQKNLYLFDASADVLVPEPVFLPRGPQLATSLIEGLVASPGDDPSRRSLRSFFPGGVTPGLSVPVRNGVADVTLTGGSRPSDPRLAAQLVWTLRQDETVKELRLTVDGRQIPLSGSRLQVSVEGGSPEYDPAGFNASTALFGLRAGVVVSGATAATLAPVTGPLGRPQRPARKLRSIAVDLPGNRVAAVAAGGTTLLLAPLQRGLGAAGAGVAQPVVGGATDLLRPAWDGQGHLWYVDRGGRQARVGVIGGGGSGVVDVRGVSGRDVRRFLVSRDGSRLVAVVHREDADVVMVSRILHNQSGSVTGATPAVRVATPDGVDRIQDIGWGSPTSLLLLSRLGGAALVRTMSIDGSPLGLEAQDVTVGASNTRLVTSPSADLAADPRLVLVQGGLFALVGPDAVDQPIVAGVTDLHYAG